MYIYRGRKEGKLIEMEVAIGLVSSNKKRKVSPNEEGKLGARIQDDPEEEERRASSSWEDLSSDTLQWGIMPCLDAQSLARCRLVCKLWNCLASSNLLWRPLLSKMLARRAQLPRQLISLSPPPCPVAAHTAYRLVLSDTGKYRLVSRDFCCRTWEINVKPSCGEYWYSLDPSTRGQPALVRYFHCDGSLSAANSDPIWGGQESSWKFVLIGSEQYIKINYWPKFEIVRLDDGRWRLENEWATYTTTPDLYIGTGMAISKEKAPPCTGCSYPRLKNAVTAIVPKVPSCLDLEY